MEVLDGANGPVDTVLVEGAETKVTGSAKEATDAAGYVIVINDQAFLPGRKLAERANATLGGSHALEVVLCDPIPAEARLPPSLRAAASAAPVARIPRTVAILLNTQLCCLATHRVTICTRPTR